MSATQFIIDASTRHQVFLQRYAGGQSKEAVTVLNRIRRNINARLMSEPTQFQAQRLETVLADIDAIYRAGFEDLTSTVTTGAAQLAGQEAAFSTELYGRTTTVGWALPSESSLLAAVAQTPMSAPVGRGISIADALAQYGTKKGAEIATAISDGVILGDTSQQIASSVNELMSHRQRNQLDALVRTVTNHASSVARMQVYEDNERLIEGYRFIATLDSRTTLICFTGQTPVVPLGALKNVFRREYSGKLITITTASGKQITGTPNHPVLTPMGWLSLDEIEPDKHVLYAPSFNIIRVGGDHAVGVPSKIAELQRTSTATDKLGMAKSIFLVLKAN